MDEALFRPFLYCCRTWEDGAAAFREELIQTARRWKELDFSGSCPFPSPDADELAIHQKHFKLFELAHKLRHNLSDLVDTASDGWVPLDEWEHTRKAHEDLFRGMLKEVMASEDLENGWVD